MLDGAILAGCVHCLKNQEHRPLVLGIKFILQLGQGCDAHRQRFLRSRFVCFLGEFKCVVRIDILETKIFTFADSEWLGQFAGSFDDLFCFHWLSVIDSGHLIIVSSFARGISLMDNPISENVKIRLQLSRDLTGTTLDFGLTPDRRRYSCPLHKMHELSY